MNIASIVKLFTTPEGRRILANLETLLEGEKGSSILEHMAGGHGENLVYVLARVKERTGKNTLELLDEAVALLELAYPGPAPTAGL